MPFFAFASKSQPSASIPKPQVCSGCSLTLLAEQCASSPWRWGSRWSLGAPLVAPVCARVAAPTRYLSFRPAPYRTRDKWAQQLKETCEEEQVRGFLGLYSLLVGPLSHLPPSITVFCPADQAQNLPDKFLLYPWCYSCLREGLLQEEHPHDIILSQSWQLTKTQRTWQVLRYLTPKDTKHVYQISPARKSLWRFSHITPKVSFSKDLNSILLIAPEMAAG